MIHTSAISRWMLIIAVGMIFLVGFGSGQIPVGSCDDLANVNDNLGTGYVLTNNLDCTGSGNSIMIGSLATPFTGSFDGSGFTITVAINTGESNVGLFRRTNGATLSNIGVAGSFSGDDYVGGLVGFATNGSTITNSYASANISGNNWVGGLVGMVYDDNTISNSYASGIVLGNDRVGGLVGYTRTTDIIESYALGDVSGSEYVGGLIGHADNSTISLSYALGDTSGGDFIGGLIGRTDNTSTVSNSYSSSTTSGYSYVGGLVGVTNNATISHSYTSGDILGNNYVGGLIGLTAGSSNIIDSYAHTVVVGNFIIGGLVGRLGSSLVENSYAMGSSSGDSTVGGLIGEIESSTITDSYAVVDVIGNNFLGGLVAVISGNPLAPTAVQSFWDTDVFGGSSALGTGKTTAEMKSLSLYDSAGRDIQARQTDLNDGYPYLGRQVGDNSPMWYIYVAPTPPSPPSGGGGSVLLVKDACPDGDFSPSYYDGICEGEISVTQRVVANITSRRAHLSTEQIQSTLNNLVFLNNKIQTMDSVSDSMKDLFQAIVEGLLAHYNG